MTQPNDPLNSDQQSLHYETTRQNVSAQAHGRRVIAALQANPRPPVTRWRAGVAGTAPDGTRFVLYRQHIRAAGSRAWRTNNPGNVYINALSRQNGAIGRDKRYAVFPDMPTGVRALKALVHSFAHSRARIHKVLNSLAPSNAGQEQVDIQTHTHAFARQLNLDPDASFESLKDADLEQLSQAIVSAGEGEQAGQIYLPGSPNTPPWANAVFEMAQASTSSTSSSG
ncbi:MAG: hypothetical protein J2P37_27375, partial [Ktedonobacteraceae bacterium]|nr:hypothetical protein [Ktedonobacteraceae bacterium]